MPLLESHLNTKPGLGFVEVRKILGSEMGNIISLIKNAIQNYPSLDVIEVTIHLSWYFSVTIPLVELLMEIKEQTKNLGDSLIKAQRLEVLGENLYVQSRHVDSSECLKEA